MRNVKCIFILPNFAKKETGAVLKQVYAWADAHDIRIAAKASHEKKLPAAFRDKTYFLRASNEKKQLRDCGFILTIGGDGTLIRGAEYAALYDLAIAGVNTGTLGFLSDIFPEETGVKLDRILHDEMVVETRSCLSASWPDGKIGSALNDIVLEKASKGGLCSVNVYCDEELVGHYRADGLILSTPTGSTAYAYAAGGPIIHAAADVTSIIPLCPQNRMNIPLVCASSHTIRIEPVQGALRVTADGSHRGSLKCNTSLRATRAAHGVKLIRFRDDWGVTDWQKRVGRL